MKKLKEAVIFIFSILTTSFVFWCFNDQIEVLRSLECRSIVDLFLTLVCILSIKSLHELLSKSLK